MNLTKSITISLACVAIAGSAMAQTFKEWQDPNINEVNRLAMHADYFAYEGIEQAKKGVQELSSNYLSLNGIWHFNWVRHANQRPTDFFKASFNPSNISLITYSPFYYSTIANALPENRFAK